MPTIKFIKKYAKDKGFKLPKIGKKEIFIHSIQLQEGNSPCYAIKHCDNMNCLWFKDCQKEYTKRA
ncbi:MAG: hypothetical protein IAA85_00045 [Firmicutes bacterium]|nr:hypothetical protein [Candidatus Alectryobacillus merdavium]